jgi:opine dehydrogenase
VSARIWLAASNVNRRYSASLARITFAPHELKEKNVASEDTVETVVIIGAGIGGIYLAAELGVAGFKLRLHDIDDARLADIRAFGGIDVEGERGGFAAVEIATSDLQAAVDGADVIIIVTGGNAQATVGRSLAPLLRDGQIILLVQGNTGGSLIVRRALDAAGCRAEVVVAEMDNYPYSCRRLAPTRIRPIVAKRWLQIAAFPGNRIAVVHPRLSRLFPQAVAAPNALYTGFTNANAMLHVANCVANAARIESGDGYRFYAEGVTPAVARLYQAINGERAAVAAALGASVPSLEDWFDRVYGVREASLVETCRRLTHNSDGPYQATGTPSSLDHKFITEDVPTGLVPMSALGVAAGVKTPAIDALVAIVRSMTGKDFTAEGRTLERLGLSGMGAAEIVRVMNEGFA